MRYVEIGVDRSYIKLIAEETSDGMALILTGGEKPHIGGVTLMTEGGAKNLSLEGHKDVIAAEEVTRIIIERTGKKAACIAGIHIDHASETEIETLLANCRTAALKLLEMMQNDTVYQEDAI